MLHVVETITDPLNNSNIKRKTRVTSKTRGYKRETLSKDRKKPREN